MIDKVVTQLDLPKINVLLILLGMIISVIIGMSTNLSQSSGHGGFIPLVFPPVLGVFFLILYFLSRAFTKKYNWILTLFAVAYLLYFGIDFYLTNNIE